VVIWGCQLLRSLGQVWIKARLVTGIRRCDHISPVLRQLHWLSVRQRVDFKDPGPSTWLFLSGHASTYPPENCCLVTDSRLRRPRSAETRTLLVSRTRTNFGDRAFSAAGTRVRNNLTTNPGQPDLPHNRLRPSLKTFVFGQ